MSQEATVDWRLRGACRSYGADLFFDPALVEDAKAVCRKCEVQEECGEPAAKAGDRWGVRAGYDLSNAAERDELRARFGLHRQARPPVSKTCQTCGAESDTHMRECYSCQGLVDAAEVREHIIALRMAGMTLVDIAAAAKVSNPSMRHMFYGRGDEKTVYTARDKAERVLAIPVPTGVPL